MGIMQPRLLSRGVGLWVGLATSPLLAQEATFRIFEHTGSPGDRAGQALVRLGGLSPSLAVGAPRGNERGLVRGYGMASGALRWTLSGETDFARFGTALADAGDRTGNGEHELWVGSPGGAGRVHALTVSGDVLVTLAGPEDGAEFGAALACLGDTNGDGVDDVVVGAPSADAGGSNAGQAALYSGADGEVLWTCNGSAFDRLGTALARIDDLDGDGVAEVAIGIPFDDAGGFNAGAIELRSGKHGALLWRSVGSNAGDRRGECVASAGDVDADGRVDVVAGRPGADLAGFDSGGASVLSGADGALLLEVAGFAAGEFACTVAGVGDLDGDGHGDLAFGSSAAVGGLGRVVLVSGADGSNLFGWTGEVHAGWFGASLCELGDTNGDGTPDLGVGGPGNEDQSDLPGRAWILSGRPLSLWSDGHITPPGGTQRLEGEFPEHGGDDYFVVGSITGIAPSLPIAGQSLSLVPDDYTLLTLAALAPLSASHGRLDSFGRLKVDFEPPEDSFATYSVWHVCVVSDAVAGTLDAISNPVVAWVDGS